MKKPVAEFSRMKARYGNKVGGNLCVCDACVERFEKEEAAVNTRSVKQARQEL